MENKDYTLDELRLMAINLGDCLMSDGYKMSLNNIKEGLWVTFTEDGEDYEFVLPYSSKDKAIALDDNMQPAYYEGFMYDKYSGFYWITREEYIMDIASVETAVELLGVYNRDYLMGEEEFFTAAKLVEDDKIGAREQATNVMKELQDANEFYRDALKTNLSVPLALDKYREELYKKTRDELTLTMVRFDFYIALGEFEKNNTPLTVKNVEITNKAYEEMLDLRGYLNTPENEVRIERYNEFDAKTKMEIKLYNGATKVIHMAGNLEDNVICIGAFYQAVEDCILNYKDNLSEAVIGELERKLNKANYDLANNKNIDDVDLQSCREKLYQEAYEALLKSKGNGYILARELFNKCVAKIQSQDFNSVQSAIDTKRELLGVNETYESILRQQCNDVESGRREDIFREASKLIDSIIVKLGKENNDYSLELEEDFYRLINTDIEDLSKSELEDFEDELTTANEKFKNEIDNEFKDSKRAGAFRSMMTRIARQLTVLEEGEDKHEPTLEEELIEQGLEDSREEEDIEIFTEQLIRRFAESVGLHLGSTRIYIGDKEPKHKPSKRELSIKEIIGNLEASKEALQKLLANRTLVTEHIQETKMLIGSVDFKELNYYNENCTSSVEKHLLYEAQKVKDEVGNLIETFNNGIESLKIKKI